MADMALRLIQLQWPPWHELTTNQWLRMRAYIRDVLTEDKDELT